MNARMMCGVWSRLAASVLACASLLGCVGPDERPPSQLEWYLTTCGYCEFQRPRADCGAGAVIRFDALGEEQLVAPPAELLGPLKVRPRKLDAGPLATHERVEVAGSRELELVHAYAPGVELAAALELEGIDAIRVTLVDPFQERIAAGTLTERVGRLARASSIESAMLQPGSLVLWNVLGVNGIVYEFLDANGYPIAISQPLAKAIGLSPDVAQRVVGGRRIEFQGRLLIGYRAWKAREVAGDVAARLEWIEQRPREVMALRHAAMHPPTSVAGSPTLVSKP